nr:hypothetical protein CKG001_05130 [Bdellovibrio sp. CKG001]
MPPDSDDVFGAAHEIKVDETKRSDNSIRTDFIFKLLSNRLKIYQTFGLLNGAPDKIQQSSENLTGLSKL